MSQKSWISIVPLLLLGVLLILVRPAMARSGYEEPGPQVVYQTPTAQPDGRIIYTVREGDSCLRIQLLTGATIEQIRTLNKLDQDCTIRPDQEILLLIVTPVASPTANPNITPTPLLPTPTPYNGNGEICVLLFNDLNGNSIREETELSIAGGAVSISDRSGQVSETGNTLDEDKPVCKTIPEGDYNISMAIPGGYNATTEMNKLLKIQAGDQHTLEFGAQISSVAPEQIEAAPVENNTMLAIMGGILVFGGIGLGVYVVFTRRN